MVKNVLICFDRDGTLVWEKKLHLGHTNDWKKKIKILPNVVEGIKLLNKKLPNSAIYIDSNQSGVAIKNYPLLTEKRAREVCEYVIDKLKKRGAKIEGYEICARVSPEYVKRRKQYQFIKKLVCSCNCIKPKTGMINNILEKKGWSKKDTLIFVLGDRYIDVRTGLNTGGYGVLIPFANEPGNVERFEMYIKGKDKKKAYVAKDFLDACRFVVGKA